MAPVQYSRCARLSPCAAGSAERSGTRGAAGDTEHGAIPTYGPGSPEEDSRESRAFSCSADKARVARVVWVFFSTHPLQAAEPGRPEVGLFEIAAAFLSQRFFFLFLLRRKRYLQRGAPVRPWLGEPRSRSARLQAPGQGSLLPHRQPAGHRRHSPTVSPAARTPFCCPAAPRLPGRTHGWCPVRTDAPFGTVEPRLTGAVPTLSALIRFT